MQTPRIAVVGSANIDLVTFTDKFPKPGQTIFGDRFDLGFGGKGANQAVEARLCGAQVDMVAKVGDDLFGPATIRNLQSYGIDTTHVRIEHGISSGVAPIFVDSTGQNRIRRPEPDFRWFTSLHTTLFTIGFLRWTPKTGQGPKVENRGGT